ncbi:MAG: nuclear transport factor 2 family protein [Litorimonas sp.]
MIDFQHEKQIVRDYIEAFDKASIDDRSSVLKTHTTPNYHWRGMHPFYEQSGGDAAVNSFWEPLLSSITSLQRRMDFFFAGANVCDDGASHWVCNAGHFMGLFDKDWLGIPSTGKIVMLRYAEFHRVEGDKIAETAFFCDIVSIMDQAGVYPLPPMTGNAFIYPGPKTHDGLLFSAQNGQDGKDTEELVHRMVDDLSSLNESGSYGCPPEVLARTWHEDMAWYGPTGIGASYTIERYQKQHQLPFRENLEGKTFNGHIARFFEGNYGGFFGWPNLNNSNRGGFLGLPRSQDHAPMRVVDLYRRDGDKLSENWVYIDILHYLFEQGLDVLTRNAAINRTEYTRPF